MGDAFVNAQTVLADPTARADALLRAAETLRAAADEGSVPSAERAGQTVIALYERAAERGSEEARTQLGELFVHGAHRLRILQDEPRGLGALRAAALADGTESVLRYVEAAHRATTSGGRRFHADAAAALNRLLEHDQDPRLLVLAAWMLHAGHGYAEDPRRAKVLLRRAADAGNADAHFELYVYATRGIAGPPDAVTALTHLRAAAHAGSPRAMANLAGRYATGDGVQRDVPSAVQWYSRAAAHGNARAAYVLAMMFEAGTDVPRDPVRAAHYRESADRLTR